MTTKLDIVDLLLQLAFIEGKITTHGLYEQSVATKRPTVQASDAARNALLQQLEAVLSSSRSRAAAPVTVGAYLRGLRHHQALQPEDVFSRLGVTSNIYKLLEHDRISPLKIPLDSWKKIRRFFQIPVMVLDEMIRRTHQLVYFRASFRTTLARYDSRKKKKTKATALEKAAEELFARATLPLPKKEQEKLDAFLAALAGDES